jgi:hypothetical protein
MVGDLFMKLSQYFQNKSKAASFQQDELLRVGNIHNNQIDSFVLDMANDSNVDSNQFFAMVTQGYDKNINTPTPVDKQVDYYQDRYEDYYISRGESIPILRPGQHQWSRREDTGEILKLPNHPTFYKTYKAETDNGYKFYYRKDKTQNKTQFDGRLYSFNAKEFRDKNPSEWSSVPKVTLDEWRWSPYDLPDIMSYVQQWEIYQPLKNTLNGYDSNSELFYSYLDSNNHSTIGIGHKLSGTSRDYTKQLLNLIAPHKDVDDLIAGRMGLTEDEVQAFFKYDMRDHIRRAERQFPLLYLEPDYMKRILIDGNFNTFFRDTHSTVKNLNFAASAMEEGNYEEALRFYKLAEFHVLDRRDYRKAVRENEDRTTPVQGGLIDRYKGYESAIQKRIGEVEQLLKPDDTPIPASDQEIVDIPEDIPLPEIKEEEEKKPMPYIPNLKPPM